MILGTISRTIPLCGPIRAAGTVEAGRTESPESLLRIVRSVNTQTVAGATVVVPFQIDAQGDENVIAFTTTWNPALFTFVSAELGPGVPAGHDLTLATNLVAQGRLGVIIGPGNSGLFAAGTRQILRVTFTVGTGVTNGVYPVGFATAPPVALGTAGLQGVILGTTYETGNIIIGPSAAGVTVSGRVTSASGQGLRNATVVITDSQGKRRTATTGSFGIYTFEDVAAGQTYVVGVSAKRYRFASRVVNVSDSLADVNFVGQE